MAEPFSLTPLKIPSPGWSAEITGKRMNNPIHTAHTHGLRQGTACLFSYNMGDFALNTSGETTYYHLLF